VEGGNISGMGEDIWVAGGGEAIWGMRHSGCSFKERGRIKDG
jgi:hypothetical protein